MPPKRTFTNPAPKTDSAREAAKNFFCELCSKGYQRHNEFEAHISSAMHANEVRLKDMKELSRDPQAAEKARRAERKADKEAGLIALNPVKLEMPAGKAGGGFKKGGFKSAFGETKKEETAEAAAPAKGGFKKAFGGDEDKKKEIVAVAEKDDADYDSDEETDSDDDLGYEKYDPAKPTGCTDSACHCRTDVLTQTLFPK